ncbi:hypothetical protein [Stenomitos frigidus]|uniref:Competence protein ComFB n=1 Tax=Stenomitos frigidus ULC18 TaxID=2107698 RepID=A0A2T1EK46_9CYAN|nr:hypothetical protein [Stenomitos frigidus]PSB33094.1 hypothetical protein C7B82_04670 [Stenomitos frigidus ULC18]
MTKALVNLTLPTVVGEIEQIVETYPHHPYQQAFANPDIRQELIAYVLSQIHNAYVAVEEGEPIAADSETTPALDESETHLKSFIHEGMQQVLQAHPELVSHEIPDAADEYLPTSHWFG